LFAFRAKSTEKPREFLLVFRLRESPGGTVAIAEQGDNASGSVLCPVERTMRPMLLHLHEPLWNIVSCSINSCQFSEEYWRIIL
jgi:hypothetical protein